MNGEFFVLGLNHATASIQERETVACKADEAGILARAVARECRLDEALVLSTCSRFEVYARADSGGQARVADWLRRKAGRNLKSALYCHEGESAVRHLMRVAGGLDSWVLGETEILGQVRSAYQQALQSKIIGRTLNLAFQRSLCAGKKVRSETAIMGGINSIGGAAALLARRIFSDLREKTILVFGAGTMAATTVRHLRSKGLRALWVANRTLSKARVLADDLGGQAMTLREGFERIVETDIAVFSLAADYWVLSAETARAVSRRRACMPLFIIDIGMPRNVEPEAASAPGVYVYDMDHLRRVVADSLACRQEDLAQACRIVEAQALDCWARITVVHPPLRSHLPHFRTCAILGSTGRFPGRIRAGVADAAWTPRAECE
ncbi:MAG: glutamyl-tRNA reductase [Elusimicrobia bacterium]|nr:glutamyl-tRNA reductase [Elusimicrobiota bacterium]